MIGRVPRCGWICVFGLALPAIFSSVARAGDRPNEDEMFGAPRAAPDGGTQTDGAQTGDAGASDVADHFAPERPAAVALPASASAPPAPPRAAPTSNTAEVSARDTDVLGDPNAAARLNQDVAPEDPLKIGGQLYLRANYSNPGSTVFDFSDPLVTTSRAVTFSEPSLVDAYFDARPNDRVRGFVLGRMFFDPTLPSTATAAGAPGTPVNSSVPLVSGVSNTRGPSVVLDQLWLRFDLLHSVFVSVGRQHVKWGTGRFWTPTDYLHPVHRNPTAVFDARPGFSMLKLHLPWEERGWNFYAFALVEGVRRWDRTQNMFVYGSDSTQTLSQVGGAARAELVFGPTELGLDLVAYRGQKPRYGADLSFGVGDFDFYIDAGFQHGSDTPLVNADCASRPAGPTGTVASACVYYPDGIKPQVVLGGTYSLKYNDNDVFTVAGEYFYNSRGYNDPRAYPALFATGLFEFFYTGRHYAALSAILPAPWSWNYTNFTFTTLGNLSDQSFISRIDYSHTLLTHLTFEAYGAVNYGRRVGEFRLGVDDLMVGNRTISLPPQLFSLGLGLRVKI
jgi:hypothetical protein